MRKALAAIALTALLIPAAVVAGNVHQDSVRPLPFPLRPPAMDMARSCALQAIRAGAFKEMNSEALADYCIDLAKRVVKGDYSDGGFAPNPFEE